MRFEYTTGGRHEAGFKADASDCVVRAIAVTTGRPYEEIYKALAEGHYHQRRTKGFREARKRTAQEGILTTRKWFKDYMQSLGFEWTATMQIGSGCKVHLREGELPMGRLVVSVSKHYTAVIDGVIYDNYDPSREGTRCVYGYWRLTAT